jgi:hypothetical protein
MTPPIFISDSGDLDVFRSVEDAERYVEAPQVLEGRCVAYDSDGRLLRLTAPKSKMSAFFSIRDYNVDRPITIEEAEADPSHQVELTDLLRAHLPRVGCPAESIANTPLEGLVTIATERIGFTT